MYLSADFFSAQSYDFQPTAVLFFLNKTKGGKIVLKKLLGKNT